MSFIAWLKKHVCEDDAWITVHPNASGPGSPVLLDDEGYIKGGMGGKFTGQRIDLMPRKGGGGRNVSGDPREQQKDEKGFLFSGRYKLKAPTQVPNTPSMTSQNVAQQATTGEANKVLSEIKTPPTVQFEKDSVGEKFKKAPIKDIVRELCWDTPSNFYLNVQREEYADTLKKIKAVEDKTTQKQLKDALETAMRNELIIVAYNSGKLSDEDWGRMDVSDSGKEGFEGRQEKLDRWNKMIRETDFRNVNKQIKSYIAQKQIDQLVAKSSFPVIVTPKVKEAIDRDIKYEAVKLRPEKLTEEQIITTIAGGDKTKGSCASVALAYIGQKLGFDVGDYRGGKSREFMSHAVVAQKNGAPDDIFKDWGATVIRENDRTSSNLMNAQKILRSIDEGKEYYFIAGRHAAIIKKQGGKVKYLELQHRNPKENGWKDLSDEKGDNRKMLKTRFCCSSGRWGSSAVDISEIKGDAFRTALGFINTKKEDQQKGSEGSVK